MSSPEPIVASLCGVVKRYAGQIALDGFDLLLRRGEVLALLGPNAAGKSSAIALLLGLIRADLGKVELFGQDPWRLSARRRIGVMLQHAELPSTLRVNELLRLTASYYPAPRTLAQSAALAGIEDLLPRPYGKLSGGQQRRVQFALALCGRPELLFLDEPTVGMELAARGSLWSAIRQLREQGCAVVLTTHYLEEAEALADRVCVIARGRLLCEGGLQALRARVATTHVRCRSTLSPALLLSWPGVQQAQCVQGQLQLVTDQAERVVRRLLDADPQLAELEMRRAGLAEAFGDLLSGQSDPPTVREVA